ncbi:hypothetical protein ACMBCN_02145 [Candidatus Liberibacter asiaticus]|nr:hypothetical protein [Candidatus Liberibacter asiaticus]
MKLFCWKLCCNNVSEKLHFLLLLLLKFFFCIFLFVIIFIYQNSLPIIMSDLQNKSNHFQ